MKILDADRIVGMMHVSQLAWLARHAARHSRILEVGSYRGRSTRVLCDNTPGFVTAVDTWLGSPGLEAELDLLRSISGDPDWLWHEFLYNMRDACNLHIVRVASPDAALSLRQFSFDMIFIDGLHDYASVRRDITAWWPLLESPGLMCGHDFHHDDVARAVRDQFPNFPTENTDADIWAVLKGATRQEYDLT